MYILHTEYIMEYKGRYTTNLNLSMIRELVLIYH